MRMINLRTILASIATLGAIGLAGCGGGGAGGTATTTPTTPGTATPSLTVALTDDAGNPVTALSGSTPTIVKATLKSASGAAVPGAVVTFSTVATIGLIAPNSGTALTDASGVATVTMSPASLTASGAASVSASSQVNGTAVTGSAGYSVNAPNVTITTPVFGVATISAFGTTSVSVTVKNNGVPVTTPVTLTFSSPCATSGKAILSASVSTVNGVATASYRDNSCAGTDTVTATVNGNVGATSSATLTVAAPAAGSIQFVSASPASITLKGMGGLGRQESSLVIFKVVDGGNNPLGGKTVSFSLSTSVGGITFGNGGREAVATSDPVTGYAAVTLNSGVQSTPVRVLASTPSGTSTLTTQSDQLTITTGIPDQDSFSLSASKLNIEGWNVDGVTTTLTARLADHFNNPVPDGTAVNFTTSGGQIVGSCTTAAGACSATLTSQNPRPTNGRVVVLAYAIGEESFIDLNGNGLADPGEMIDINGRSTDMGEAFRDDNENGARAASETFIDFNADGTYNGPDGKFSGVLCNPAAGTFCSSQKSIHVRDQIAIVFSGSTARISLPSQIDLSAGGGVAGCWNPQYVLITVVDENGNVMPAGTTIDVTTSNGTVNGKPPSTSPLVTFIVSNTNVLGAIPYVISMGGDGTTSNGTCTDSTQSGVLTVKVTTPLGTVTSAATTVLH